MLLDDESCTSRQMLTLKFNLDFIYCLADSVATARQHLSTCLDFAVTSKVHHKNIFLPVFKLLKLFNKGVIFKILFIVFIQVVIFIKYQIKICQILVHSSVQQYFLGSIQDHSRLLLCCTYGLMDLC